MIRVGNEALPIRHPVERTDRSPTVKDADNPVAPPSERFV